MACVECHLAKVKCDGGTPCARCIRNSKDCIKHKSNQGRGKRRRLDSYDFAKETEWIAEQISTLAQPRHYGVIWLIRFWVYSAMRRRSFHLLAKASMLAVRHKVRSRRSLYYMSIVYYLSIVSIICLLCIVY